MKKENVLVLTRNELNSAALKKDISEITRTDIKGSISPFNMSSITIFVDDDGSVKTLKNRYK